MVSLKRSDMRIFDDASDMHICIRAILSAYEADWVRNRLLEFADIDSHSTAFRCAGATFQGRLRADGEWWIDFRHLQETMAIIILQLLEVVAWGDAPDEGNNQAHNNRQRI